jgi:DNA-binding PadR family transcriptional regulator
VNIASKHEEVAMHSSIAWALLGLLIERPSYGYELAQRFERTYEDMLTLSSTARIYTALETLSARGLIEETPAGDRRTALAREPKPHYQATEQGNAAYEVWLLAQIGEERKRSQLFARQLAMLEPEQALEVIDRYEQECLTETAPSAQSEPTRETAAGIAARLAQAEDRLALDARLSWLEYARNELKALIPGRTKRR